MTCKTVTYRREGRIAYVTLNRSRVLNAVNKALEQDLGRMPAYVRPGRRSVGGRSARSWAGLLLRRRREGAVLTPPTRGSVTPIGAWG